MKTIVTEHHRIGLEPDVRDGRTLAAWLTIEHNTEEGRHCIKLSPQDCEWMAQQLDAAATDAGVATVRAKLLDKNKALRVERDDYHRALTLKQETNDDRAAEARALWSRVFADGLEALMQEYESRELPSESELAEGVQRVMGMADEAAAMYAMRWAQ